MALTGISRHTKTSAFDYGNCKRGPDITAKILTYYATPIYNKSTIGPTLHTSFVPACPREGVRLKDLKDK